MKRPSSRLLIVDDEGRLLLFLFRYQDRSFWATPGGALETGETFEQAAGRELFEETGLNARIGPSVWQRQTRFIGPDGDTIDALEQYFLVRVIEPALDFDHWQADEAATIRQVAWLSPNEIAILSDPIFPENISEIVQKALTEE